MPSWRMPRWMARKLAPREEEAHSTAARLRAAGHDLRGCRFATVDPCPVWNPPPAMPAFVPGFMVTVWDGPLSNFGQAARVSVEEAVVAAMASKHERDGLAVRADVEKERRR